MSSDRPERSSYDKIFGEFDSPLMQQVRSEAYVEDIGQHSWVTANELRTYITRLQLSPRSHLLDLGCGPGGPLAFIAQAVGCTCVGTDVSARALAAVRARAASLCFENLILAEQVDLDRELPFRNGAFDAAIALDVIVHLHDRVAVFREVARILIRAGLFLFTDAGVLTGSISNREVEWRATHGLTQFAAPGFNEDMLEVAGFRLLEQRDTTSSLLENATGRFAARTANAAQLREVEGTAAFDREQRYLQTVIGLSERKAIARIAYLAQCRT